MAIKQNITLNYWQDGHFCLSHFLCGFLINQDKPTAYGLTRMLVMMPDAHHVPAQWFSGAGLGQETVSASFSRAVVILERSRKALKS